MLHYPRTPRHSYPQLSSSRSSRLLIFRLSATFTSLPFPSRLGFIRLAGRGGVGRYHCGRDIWLGPFIDRHWITCDLESFLVSCPMPLYFSNIVRVQLDCRLVAIQDDVDGTDMRIVRDFKVTLMVVSGSSSSMKGHLPFSPSSSRHRVSLPCLNFLHLPPWH